MDNNQVLDKELDKQVMDLALEAYRQYIIADYDKMYEGQPCSQNKFEVEFMPGKRFIRVVTTSNGIHRSSHSFIEVATGLIWKSASWKAPALNFSRGSILDRTFERVAWTGAH